MATKNDDFYPALVKVLTGEDTDIKTFKETYLRAWFTRKEDVKKYKQPVVKFGGMNYLVRDILPGPSVKLIASVFFLSPNTQSTASTTSITITSLDEITEGEALTFNPTAYLNDIEFPNIKTGENVIIYTLPAIWNYEWARAYNTSEGAYVIYGTPTEITDGYIGFTPFYAAGNIQTALSSDSSSDGLYIPLAALPNVIAEEHFKTKDLIGKYKVLSEIFKDYAGATFMSPKTVTLDTTSSPVIPFTPLKKRVVPDTKKPAVVVVVDTSKDAFKKRDAIKRTIATLEINNQNLADKLRDITKTIKKLEWEAQQLACKREAIDPRNNGSIGDVTKRVMEKRKEITEKEHERESISIDIQLNKDAIAKARTEIIALHSELFQ